MSRTWLRDRHGTPRANRPLGTWRGALAAVTVVALASASTAGARQEPKNPGVEVFGGVETRDTRWRLLRDELARGVIEVDVLVTCTDRLLKVSNGIDEVKARVDAALEASSLIATQASLFGAKATTAGRPKVRIHRAGDVLVMTGSREADGAAATDPSRLLETLLTKGDGAYEELFEPLFKWDIVLFLTPSFLGDKVREPLGSLTGAVSMPLTDRVEEHLAFHARYASALVIRWHHLGDFDVLTHWIGHLAGCSHADAAVSPVAPGARGARVELFGALSIESLGASAACHYEFLLEGVPPGESRGRIPILASPHVKLPTHHFDGVLSSIPFVKGSAQDFEAIEFIESLKWMARYSEMRNP